MGKTYTFAIISYDSSKTPAGRTGIITTTAPILEMTNTESQGNKRLGQIYTLMQTLDLGLQSHPSPYIARLQTASHPNLILKAHVCTHTHFIKCNLFSPFYELLIYKYTAKSLHQLLHQHAKCCWKLDGVGKPPHSFKPSLPVVLCSPSHLLFLQDPTSFSFL